jgi:ABC-type oligopeptide transport system substrate-binding subunit
MNLYIAIGSIFIVSLAMLYVASKSAHEEKEEEVKPKHEARKVTYTSFNKQKPKRKKKLTLSEYANIEKRPVGRPRKTIS